MRRPTDDPPVPDAPAPTKSRAEVRSNGLAAIAIVGAALCIYVAFPLLAPLVWAMVLALVAQPLHRRVEKRVKRPNVAAGLVVVAVGLLIAVPFVFVVAQLLQQAADGVSRLRSGEAERLWQQTLAEQPLLGTLVEWIGRRVDLKGAGEQALTWATGMLQRVIGGSVAGATGWLIALFALFFMLRDRVAMLGAVERFMPTNRDETHQVFDVVDDTVHATFWGTLAMGLAQGALGALVFWWLKLPAPLLWGAVMVVLSVLPVLGAALVWMPVAGWLALQGRWTEAIALVAFGAIVIGLIDNLIYPLVVKDRMHLHAVPVFVAILGGLVAFGATGIVLGPLLLAVTDALVTIWRRRLGL